MTGKTDSGKPDDRIEKCRKGDRKAQYEIYRLYYKAMYNAALRIVSIPGDAEDIMQESFLSAFRKIDSYIGDVSFGAWLKKIVINKSIDLLRQRKTRFEEIQDEASQDHVEILFEPDVEDSLQVENYVRRIKNAIKELPKGYEVVLTLALIEGYDHEEISQILSISESTSRSQLARAKKKLIEILNQGKR
jgi:RNA polymerase sigma factor (sigma-70 family)